MGYDPMTHRPRTDIFSTLSHLLALANLKNLLDHNASTFQFLQHHLVHQQQANPSNGVMNMENSFNHLMNNFVNNDHSSSMDFSHMPNLINHSSPSTIQISPLVSKQDMVQIQIPEFCSMNKEDQDGGSPNNSSWLHSSCVTASSPSSLVHQADVAVAEKHTDDCSLAACDDLGEVVGQYIWPNESEMFLEDPLFTPSDFSLLD